MLTELYKHDEEAKKIIREFSLGAEKPVFNIPVTERSKTGRADTQYRRVIIEFEKDIANRTKLEHAEYQLKEYLAGNWNSGNDYNFTLIATDGVRWIIFGPLPESYIGKEEIKPQELEFKELERVTLDESNTDGFFLFVDRYLFRNEKQVPTLDTILTDFGESSEVFIEAFDKMKRYFESVKEAPSIKTSYREWEKFLSVAYGKFEGSSDVYIVHTYLSVFAKLLAYEVITKDDFIDKDELLRILNGSIFHSYNLHNFVENDFYQWVIDKTHYQQLHPVFRKIALKLSDYDFTNVRADILKGVYQELIDLETRHALGEYYTPDWLCELVVDRYQFERNSRVLDPSCGSGSFLIAIINKLRGQFPDISAEELAEQVSGIDIHPLSVQIAKASLLIGFGDLLTHARRPVFLNVFLSNSILTPDDSVTAMYQDFRIKIDGKNYFIPSEVFQDATLYDLAITIADKLAEESAGGEEEAQETLVNTIRRDRKDYDGKLAVHYHDIYKAFKKAKEDGRDSIWKFILQNSYKPLFLKQQFDYVIGNPPWFTYSSINNAEYQDQLSRLAEKYHLIPAKKANIPHLEIAAVFLSHATSYFLRSGGQLAFVLPRSFLSAEHHDNTRSGQASGFQLTEVWDLDNVAPLFNVPSCVLFAQKANVSKAIPKDGISGRQIKGTLKQHNMVLADVRSRLTISPANWYYAKLNQASALTTSPSQVLLANNFYKKYFRQGATLVPRSFYFVRLQGETPPDWDDRQVAVCTDEAILKDAKMPWKALTIEGRLHTSFLFRTALAKNIVPFALINPPLVTLPLEIDEAPTIHLQTHDQIRKDGHMESSRWFKQAEELWDKNKTNNNKKISSVDYLNWQNKLVDQDLAKRYLVLYTSSAKDANATVVDRTAIDLDFIVESAAYVFYTSELDEAYFLCCFFNAQTPNLLIKDFQARGLFGARHVHKKILDVPLPQFDAEHNEHQRLASLGRQCQQRVAVYVQEQKLAQKDYRVGSERRAIRQLLSVELEGIDQVLRSIIGL